MAQLKKSELKNMNETQIKQKLTDLKKELIKMNAQKSAGTTPENPGLVKAVKRNIARINTILNQKQTGQKPKEEVAKE